MKTSATQFEMIVSFMETHGDINKPTKTAQGRMKAIKEWENLTNFLNSDATGETKTTEKWKKVWSDLKNNIKKKAAKIHKAAYGTGGGPALQIRLTELEERVLNIIGPQSATGLPVVEAGLPIVYWMRPGSSHQPHIPPPVTPPPLLPIPLSPPVPTPQTQNLPNTTAQDQPAPRGQTPRRRRISPMRRRDATRRRIAGPQSHLEQVSQQFMQSDEMWRNFLIKKHEDELQLEREKLHVQQLEIQSQQRWQDVAFHAIDILDKFINQKK
ncbi:unnamed protein product [Diatraea saccharalis]|uniref:Regulatory protein zeste n=1 Tax=Diatraea saccharalis TaxID=40085 RepID=A0A9N9QZW7_9NEOP|nr:unnamed protein product [Diatraea saccharalis]